MRMKMLLGTWWQSAFSQPAFSDFEFRVGETWLSSWYVPLITICTYYLVLSGIKRHVANNKPYNIKKVVVWYNLVISIASAVLFLLLFSEIVNLIYSSSFFAFWCDDLGKFSSGRHHLYYYINYLFKYVELFDTVFLCLSGKPTPFLHVYHHSATLVLCWTQLAASNCVQWVPIVINLLVHVVMYYYYHRVTAGHVVSWKKYVTVIQITQFVLGVSLCIGPYTLRNMHTLSNGTYGYRCHGEFLPATFGVFILASYLVLFMRFFSQTYKAKKKHAARKSK